jgi:hypothetical protein
MYWTDLEESQIWDGSPSITLPVYLPTTRGQIELLRQMDIEAGRPPRELSIIWESEETTQGKQLVGFRDANFRPVDLEAGSAQLWAGPLRAWRDAQRTSLLLQENPTVRQYHRGVGLRFERNRMNHFEFEVECQTLFLPAYPLRGLFDADYGTGYGILEPGEGSWVPEEMVQAVAGLHDEFDRLPLVDEQADPIEYEDWDSLSTTAPDTGAITSNLAEIVALFPKKKQSPRPQIDWESRDYITPVWVCSPRGLRIITPAEQAKRAGMRNLPVVLTRTFKPVVNVVSQLQREAWGPMTVYIGGSWAAETGSPLFAYNLRNDAQGYRQWLWAKLKDSTSPQAKELAALANMLRHQGTITLRAWPAEKTSRRYVQTVELPKDTKLDRPWRAIAQSKDTTTYGLTPMDWGKEAAPAAYAQVVKAALLWKLEQA